MGGMQYPVLEASVEYVCCSSQTDVLRRDVVSATSRYCRHCVLATRRDGVPEEARESFLDDTRLVDRTTTLRQYLADRGAHVMASTPPASLTDRYSG